MPASENTKTATPSVRHNRWARDTYKKLLRGSKSSKEDSNYGLGQEVVSKVLGNATR